MALRRPPWPLSLLGGADFARGVVQVAAEDPLTATSWWRSPLENHRVGGDPWSQHLVGWALDVTGPNLSAVAKRARIAGFTAVVESDHLHIQRFPAGTLRRLFQR